MKVLVTGATGFIGHTTVELLLKHGHHVRALVRKSSDTRLLKSMEVETFEGDVTIRGSIIPAARDIDAVIHCAAWVSLYSGKLEDMRRVNVAGVENMASVALEVGAQRLVHVSSILAVGASPDGQPVDETFTWPGRELDTPYLITKREAERICFQYARLGMDVVVVNPCLVVGAPDPRGVDPGAIRRYLRRKIPARIPGGTNYVDVWDVAHGIVAALERGRSGERYILGGENLTFRSAYKILEELSGVPAPRIAAPLPMVYGLAAGFDRIEQWTGQKMPLTRHFVKVAGQTWFADTTKARQELALPHTPIRDSFRNAIAYYRDHDMV